MRLGYHSRSREAAVILRSPMNASTVMREVSAYNTAAASDNKIHDDCVARRFGFRGGLVPGVEKVYAYMAHMPVARCGARGSRGAVPATGSGNRFMTGR